MGSFKIVITDGEYASFDGEKKIFEDDTFTLHIHQCKTEDEVIEAAKDADAILNQYAPVTRKVIEQLTKCKVITRYGVGVDTIDVEAATDHSIIVANVTDYCIDEVSDHAIALLLSLSRKINSLDRSVKSGEWSYNHIKPVNRLRGMTLGICGFGSIGREVARKAQAFNLKVIAFDPYVDEQTAKKNNVKLVDFDTVLQESDFLSLHMPLNKQTEHMIDVQALTRVKSNVYIINTGRGGLIDEDALIDALKNGKIAGAGLDVVETIPLKSPLDKLDNVIVTPHVGYYSESSLKDLQRIAAEQCRMVLDGYFPKCFVNRELKNTLSLKEA